MRSAPTLKIWMTPEASVAMLEKLALLKMALCNAPVFSNASACWTLRLASAVSVFRLRAAAMRLLVYLRTIRALQSSGSAKGRRADVCGKGGLAAIAPASE